MIMIVFMMILAADQISKFWVSQNLQLFESQSIVDNVLYLTLIHNTGAAFGIFKGHATLFAILTIIFMAIIILSFRKYFRSSVLYKIIFGLFLGGACGNLIDRLYRGYVIDFIDVQVWPVFNVADAAITVSVVLYFLLILFKKETRYS